MRNIAQGLNIDRAYEVGAMTERNIASTDRKKSYYCIYCQRIKDKKKRRHFAMAPLCNSFTLQLLHFATTRHHIAMAVYLLKSCL